ncbi:metallophosphoesterase [Bacillus sp. AK031]
MKIVVISDTHMPKRGQELPPRLIKELKKADLIIHGGDWDTMDVYHMLKQYGKVEGVHGNTDSEEICSLFPERLILHLNGYKLGVVHGHGIGKTTEKRVMDAFEEKPDIIIFGHSHIPFLRYTKGVLLFNPGSATDKRKMPSYSFGIIEIENELKAQHVFYNDKKNE